jgi:hypothetical protein
MKKKSVRVLLAGVACALAGHAGAVTLQFEDVLFAAEYRNVYEMWELGPQLYSAGYYLRYAPAPGEPYPTQFAAMGPLWRFNGRDTIAVNANSCSARVTLVAEDNNPFNLESIDLQELNGVEAVPVSVTFTGVTASQRQVSHSVTLNKSAEWETVRFPATFKHLQEVEWHQGNCITNFPHMFDNIQLVPSHKARPASE